MIVVQTYKQNAGQFLGITSAVTWESCKRRLRLYFKDVREIKAKILNGEKISIPYVVLQKDRRKRDIKSFKRTKKTQLASQLYN